MCILNLEIFLTLPSIPSSTQSTPISNFLRDLIGLPMVGVLPLPLLHLGEVRSHGHMATQPELPSFSLRNARGYGLAVLRVDYGAELIVRLQRIKSLAYPRGIKVLANCLPLPLKLVTN